MIVTLMIIIAIYSHYTTVSWITGISWDIFRGYIANYLPVVKHDYSHSIILGMIATATMIP
jgi:hypothetical protein